MKALFKYIKTPEQIKNQIEFWFLKYHAKEKSDFNGREAFTFFELIDQNEKEVLGKSIILNKSEIPVLILRVSNSEFIINTTEKFIRIKEHKTEVIHYIDFNHHQGYRLAIGLKDQSTNKMISVKTDGYLSEFGFVLNDDRMVFWQIPTGSLGFAFWNVTKKCNLIGRKYLEKKISSPNP